jgi:cytochrome c553
MRYSPFILLLGLMYGCNGKAEADQNAKVESADTTKPASGKNFEMYTMSEMSLLMEQMYVDNERLRERIIKGDTIGPFPNHFLGIHNAVMTDDKEHDAFFKEHASKFITAQEQIYKDPANAKKHFNESVNACIACHEVKCGGPITRIKKLYIK